MTYDEKCWNLAKSFLADYGQAYNDVAADELAQVIQRAIEDYLSMFPLSK